MTNVIAAAFQDAAGLHPDGAAVVCPHGVTTYAALDAYAARIAAALREAGAAPGRIVGLRLPAGADYVAGMLACLRLGCVFLPLDTAWPRGRVQAVLEAARPAVVVAGVGETPAVRALCEAAGAGATPVVAVGGGEARVEHAGAAGAGGPALPPEACYLVFTSGSTGRPKGILGRSDSLLHFIRWEQAEFGLGPSTRVPFLAPTSFDVSLRDVFAPLLAGGAVCVPDAAARANPVLLAEWLGRTGASHVHLVPSLGRLLVHEAAGALASSGAAAGVRELVFAGEPLYGRDVRAVRRAFGQEVGISNVYGPTETTLARLFLRLGGEAWDDGEIVPLGRPIPHTRVHVRAPGGGDAAPGESGEIVVATPYASCGYLRDGRLSLEGFTPLGDEAGRPVLGFATGDRGRMDADGRLCYLGRLDHMLKVRGNRVELLEVEATVRATGIESASIAAEEADDGDHRLHCFYVAAAADAALEERLRARVRAALPEYMHPASYTAVAALPATTSGKLDRRALLELRPAAPAAGGGGTADPLEAELAAEWARVLGVAEVPLDAPFHALGGSSLRAMQLIARVFRKHRVALNVQEVLGQDSVRTLAALVRGRASPGAAAPPPRPAGDAAGDHPLSPYQRMMWDVAQHPPAVRAYHEHVAVELPFAPEPALCRRVLEALVERHEILRTAFVEVDGEPVQRVLPAASVPLEIAEVDLRGEADPDAAWRAHFLEDAERPFDLARPPLFRCHLYRLGDGRAVAACALYHIVCDLFSVDVAVREARALYAGLAAGQAPSLPPLERQYRHFAAETVREEAQAHDEARAFWAGYLPSPLPELALSERRPFLKSFRGDTRGFQVAPRAVARLREAAAAHGVTPFVVGLAAYARILAGAAPEGRLVVGCAVSLRDRPELDTQLGLYLNVLPVALDTSEAADAAGFVRHVNGSVMRALRFKDYPVQHIARDLALPLRLSRAPLYDATFTLAERAADSGPPLVPLPRRHAKFDLSLTLTMTGSEVGGVAEFDPAIVDGERADALVGGYLAALDELCAQLGAGVAR